MNPERMTSLKLILTLIALLAPFSASVLAQTTLTYYVSDAGNDANPGSASQPFRTIQKCVNQFRDTTQVICNCAGTFNEEISIAAGGPSPERRSKIIAWDTDGDGLLQDETFILDGGGTRNETIKTANSKRPDNIEIAWAVFRNYEPDGGCNSDEDGELHFIKMDCSGGNACTDWWIHDNLFEKLGTNCNVESHYIAIQPSGAPRLMVENNRFDSVGGFIMRYVAGKGIRFRNNHVIVTGTGIKAWDNPDSIEIVGNIFECDGNGINKPGDTRCGGQAAVSLSNNVAFSQIRNNTFIDCVTPINIGTDARFGLKDNGPHLIEGNRIYQSGKVCNAFAPAIEVSDKSDTTENGDSVHVFGVTIRNNIIAWVDSTRTSFGTAFLLTAGHPFPFESDIRIYNNTVRSYGRGILLSLATESAVPYQYQLNGVVVRNNIFSDIKDEFFTLAGNIGSWPDSSRALNWDSDYNLYSGRDRITWGGTRYTLAQWKAAKGEDAHSRFASPLFVTDSNRLRPLFKLAANDTMALNRGNTIPAVATDFSGLPRPMGGAWEIGAHEVKGVRLFYASASTGNDSNAGTADQPFRTLQHGLEMWNGIDQFELRGAGVFGEELVVTHGGLNADSLNRLLPWDTDGDGSLADETLMLDGGNTMRIALQTDVSATPDYVSISGVTFGNYSSVGCNRMEEVRFIRLKGNPENDIEGWRLEGNTFRNLGRGCENGGLMGAITASGVRDLRIERNRFDSITGPLLTEVEGTDIYFGENNAHIIGQGISTGGNVDSFRIVDNVFIGDGSGSISADGKCRKQYGINLENGARHTLIRGNAINGCSDGIRLGVSSDGTRTSAHHIIERNVIDVSDAGCVSARPGITIADYGDVTESGDSIHIENVLIRNNVVAFHGNPRVNEGAIVLAAGHPYPFVNDIRIYNNTIDGFSVGLMLKQREEDDGVVYKHELNGVKVMNNIFHNTAEAQFKFVKGLWPDSLPSSWESDYNVFEGSNAMSWGAVIRLERWQNLTGQDAHSTLCEPAFIAQDTLFHLSSVDLCALDAGVALNEVTDDIDGDERPYNDAIDIGADEFSADVLGRVVTGDAFGRGDERTKTASLSDLRLYPNPASKNTSLDFFLPEAGPVVIRVFGATGIPSARRNLFLEQGWNRVDLRLDGMSEGIYLIRVGSAGSDQTIRLIVVH